MADARDRGAIANDYRSARDRGDAAAMRRYQNEEACFVLLAILGHLAANDRSFVHEIALKGGILMAGELRSARSSADIDATTGQGRRIDPDRAVADLRRAGREFGVRLDGEPDRTLGGLIVHFRFESLTDAGTAKLEVSVREDLIFAVREAFFDVSDLGLQPFTVPALAQVELVVEKLRALVLSVDRNVADLAGMRLDEFLARDEHPAGAAARVVDAAPVRREHLHQHSNDVGRRVELAALLALGAGELGKEVFVDPTELIPCAGG